MRSRSMAPLLSALSSTLSSSLGVSEEFVAGTSVWLRDEKGALLSGKVLSAP